MGYLPHPPLCFRKFVQNKTLRGTVDFPEQELKIKKPAWSKAGFFLHCVLSPV